MRLHDIANQRRFPVIQFELGGTWAAHDPRHNDQWSQMSTVQYLQLHGCVAIARTVERRRCCMMYRRALPLQLHAPLPLHVGPSVGRAHHCSHVALAIPLAGSRCARVTWAGSLSLSRHGGKHSG